MKAYYNDNDRHCCAWLKELIHEGLIADGDVDERSISEVKPAEVKDYVQCHYFAGAGGWSLALRLAGWPDDRPVWTGSCPCQPFSVAGKQQGDKDKRHLWPEFYRLVKECHPPAVFGEQTTSRLGRKWLAGVFSDLEAVAYAVAGADLCAVGVSAPWIIINYTMTDKEAEDAGHTRVVFECCICGAHEQCVLPMPSRNERIPSKGKKGFVDSLQGFKSKHLHPDCHGPQAVMLWKKPLRNTDALSSEMLGESRKTK